MRLLYLLLVWPLAMGEKVPAQPLYCGNLSDTNQTTCFLCKATNSSAIQWQVNGENTTISSAENSLDNYLGLGFYFTSILVSSETVNGQTVVVSAGILTSPSTFEVMCISPNSISTVNTEQTTEERAVKQSRSGNVTLRYLFEASFSGNDGTEQIRGFSCSVTDKFLGWQFNNNSDVRAFTNRIIFDSDRFVDQSIDSSRTAVILLYVYPNPLVSLSLVVGPPFTIKCINGLKEYVVYTVPDKPTQGPTNAATLYHTPPKPRPTYNNSEDSDVTSSEFLNILPMKFVLLPFLILL